MDGIVKDKKKLDINADVDQRNRLIKRHVVLVILLYSMVNQKFQEGSNDMV